MPLPFFSTGAKKRDQIVAIDLGSRTTKAVYLQRKGDILTLSGYSIQDAPIYEKGISAELLAAHLRAIYSALGAKNKQVVLALGVADSLLRNTELPQIPVSEMRLMLKFNTKNYLQQDLPDQVFDCHIEPPREMPNPDSKTAPKLKVWVGGAKNQLLNTLQAAVKSAGLIPEQVTLGILGPVNAFELTQPEIFAKEVVALVDLGFKNSTINVLMNGELVLSRVVGIGGDKLTTGLSEAVGISYAEAEGIKIGMPSEVESALQPLLSPLGRELRASIDFFEHQQDRTVNQVFISGGAATSEFMIQALQAELMVACKSWNPVGPPINVALSGQQMGEVEQIAPQLSVAIGAGVSAF